MANGSGTINLAGLLLDTGVSNAASVDPSSGNETTGAGFFSFLYGTVTGPSSFGPGGTILADTASGDLVGVDGSGGALFLPVGYVSEAPLLDTATYTGRSFASLGLTPGTYVYTWGSGPTADTFTVQIGSAAVPEPADVMLLGAGLLGLGLARRTRV